MDLVMDLVWWCLSYLPGRKKGVGPAGASGATRDAGATEDAGEDAFGGLEQALSKLTIAIEELPERVSARVQGAVASALQQDRLNAQSVIRRAISNATVSLLKQVTDRTGRPLQELLFPAAPAGAVAAPPAFKWPPRKNGVEDEVSGYPEAKEFWDAHIAPAGGLQLVLTPRDTSWMQCTPAPNVEITGGGTDALLTLAECAAALKEDVGHGDRVLGHLLAICGQVEYKTVAALQKDFYGERAQAGLEHICAVYLQELTINRAAAAYGKDVTALPAHQFITIMTDNNGTWVLFIYRADALCVLQSRRPSDTPAAIDYIKVQLHQAADKQRALYQALLAPRSESATASTQDEETDDTGPDARDRHAERCPPNQHGAAGMGKAASGQPSSSRHSATHNVQPKQGGSQASHDQLAIVQEMQEDDDYAREAGAGYHRLLTSFLRSEMGYRDLLRVDAPPSTLQLPDVETLWNLPLSAQSQLVRAAMQQVLAKEQHGGGQEVHLS